MTPEETRKSDGVFACDAWHTIQKNAIQKNATAGGRAIDAVLPSRVYLALLRMNGLARDIGRGAGKWRSE